MIRESHSTGFEFVACLESPKTKSPFTFEFWGTDTVTAFFPIIKEPSVALINADNHRRRDIFFPFLF